MPRPLPSSTIPTTGAHFPKILSEKTVLRTSSRSFRNLRAILSDDTKLQSFECREISTQRGDTWHVNMQKKRSSPRERALRARKSSRFREIPLMPPLGALGTHVFPLGTYYGPCTNSTRPGRVVRIWRTVGRAGWRIEESIDRGG